mgnify:CR=1 FL=1
MWKIKEIALFLEKSAEKFCWFKKTSTLHSQLRKEHLVC